MISSWVMIFIMSATPLGMKSKEYSIDEITNVIQFHILGMFVPSFFTGNLIKKFGLRIILFIGIFFCMLCVFINLLNHSNHHYLPSLILLGIGWNFLFVGSTRILLTNINEKLLTKAQALNDFSVTGFTSISLAFTGLIHSKLGYENLNLITIPFLFIAIYLSLDLTKKKLMKTK
jgi:MFS family permease